MPLPDGGKTCWPPRHCAPINQQYATWSAWWRGDTEQLATIYGGTGGSRDTTGFFASEQGGFRGGVRRAVDAVRRWFWGARSGSGTGRQRLHAPLASDIATASADLLFGEPPTVTADPDGPDGLPVDDRTQQRLDLLWGDDTHAVLLEAAEICAALGGVYLRLVWGPDRPCPWITAHHPDMVVPEWRWGSLAAATLWREVARDGRTVWRHLERHEPGRIWHGLYVGTTDELGTRAPLTARPETAELDGRDEVSTGVDDRLTVVYVPNVRPSRSWPGVPEAACLGRPDIAGSEPLLDALDLTWSSWVRDVDLGKARLIVPREYMQSLGAGQGATVDLDREIYEPVSSMSQGDGGMEIKEVQPAIRVDEHARSVDALKREIVGSAGYAAGTFGLDGGGAAATATEIVSRDRRSLTTRSRKIRYWRSGLADLLETWTYVDANQYQSGITPQRPMVEWADAVSVDPLTEGQTLQALHTAQAISTEEKVRTRRPDWSDDQVAAEVERIRVDYGLAVEDPGMFTGAQPDATPGDDITPQPPEVAS